MLRVFSVGLPVVLTAAAVILEVAKGSPHPVALIIAGGAAFGLGLTLTFLLRALALLGGDLSPSAATRRAKIRSLEADLGGLERTLGGIELDAAMKRMDAAGAQELASPLEGRAEAVRRELSLLHDVDVEGVDAEIEREVLRRLRQRAGGEA